MCYLGIGNNTRYILLCAGATRKSRRWGDELFHRNTYECLHIDDDVCDVYIYPKNSKQTAQPTFSGRESRYEQPERDKQPDVGRGRLQPRVCGKNLDVTDGLRPKKSQPRKVCGGIFTVGVATKFATLLA